MSEPGAQQTNTTDRLLASLVDDAKPVRRIYPLGRVALGVAVLYVLWWIIGVRWMMGEGSGAALAEAMADGFFVGIVTSLVGATGYALAAREPGRERVARVSWVCLAIGVAAAVATFVTRSGDAMGELSLYAEMQCTEHALGFGLLPALGLLFVCLGGWRGRPVVAALAAAVSGVSLGALMVQATCPADGAWHVMLGHYVGPLATTAAFVAACMWCWRRFAER